MGQKVSLRFFLPIKPKPKGNAKELRKRRGKLVIGNPQRHKDHQAALRAMAWLYAPDRPLKGPIRLDVTFVLPLPKAAPKWKVEAARANTLRPTVRPDRGNLLKMIEDALEGVIYTNDSHVVEGMVRKVYGEEPGYEIHVEELSQVSTYADWKAYVSALGVA